MKKPMQTSKSDPTRDAAARRRNPGVGHGGVAAVVAATIAALAPAAAAAQWESRERDVPVATAQGLAVSLTVAEVVYKTSPFEIVVVVDNSTDQAVEITVGHGADALYPALSASIRGERSDSSFSLLPVLPEGFVVWGGFIGKQMRHAYKVPARGRLSFRGEIDWRNYPDRIDRIDPGRYRLLASFSYTLGDNTARPRFSFDDDGVPIPPPGYSLPESYSVSWYLSLEIRDEET